MGFDSFKIGISLGWFQFNLIKLPDKDTWLSLNLINWKNIDGKRD